jgi:hypothetical protein
MKWSEPLASILCTPRWACLRKRRWLYGIPSPTRAGYLTSTITDSGSDHTNTINGKRRSLVQRCECIDRGIKDGEEGRAAMEESAKKNLRRITEIREMKMTS